MCQSGEKLKTCSVCEAQLPITSFTKDAYRPDGLKHLCRKCTSVQHARWKSANPSYRKEYHERNKDREHTRNNNYARTHREQIRQTHAERYRNDPQYKAAYLLRGRLRNALGGTAKSDSTKALLGCNWYQFQEWMRYQFLPGMTWANHGKVWHLDHVIPIAAFDLRIADEQQKCFHWTNFQPLYAEDNLRKNSFYDGVKHTRVYMEGY